MQAAQLPPVAALNEFSRRYQGVWRDLEDIRNSQDGWPSWCYVPSAEAIKAYGKRARIGAGAVEIMTLVGALHALGSWRLSQNIYRFEPELAQAIIDTPLAASEVPVDILLRLPEWSLYIELPAGAGGLLEGLHGFWATLDYYDNFAPVLQFVTCNTGDLERRLAAGSGMIEGWNGMSDHNALTLYDLPLVPGMTIQETLDDSMRQVKGALSNPDHLSRRSALEAMAEMDAIRDSETLAAELFQPMLNLVLYLCAQEPDVEGGLPSRPVATKTKRGPRWFPAQKPAVREVGARVVKWIREARAQSTSRGDGEASGRSVTPHMRKAHWHGYWTGPRKDPEARNFSLKWLPPTPVGVKEAGGEVAPTVRVVE